MTLRESVLSFGELSKEDLEDRERSLPTGKNWGSNPKGMNRWGRSWWTSLKRSSSPT